MDGLDIILMPAPDLKSSAATNEPEMSKPPRVTSVDAHRPFVANSSASGLRGKVAGVGTSSSKA